MREVSVTITDSTKFGITMNDLRKRDTHNFTVLTFPAGDMVSEEMREAEQASTTTLQVGNFAFERKFLGGYPLNDGDTQDFDVLVRSFNKVFIERVELKRTNGHWSKAIMVEVPSKYNDYWTKIDKDFPRKEGHLDVNWPRRVVGRDYWDR